MRDGRPVPTAWERAAAVALCSIGAALATAACSPSDVDPAVRSEGTRVSLGRLVLTDVRVLVAAEGQPGIVLGAIRNDGTSNDVVFLSLPGSQATAVVVEGGQTLHLGPGVGDVFVATMTPPAQSADLVVQSTRYGSRTLEAVVTSTTAVPVEVPRA